MYHVQFNRSFLFVAQSKPDIAPLFIRIKLWRYITVAVNRNTDMEFQPIPVATRSKAYVCGRPLAGIAELNPAGGMDVCLLWVLFVVR
jgi:hypothetical protein